MTAELMGWQKHLHLRKEEAWGVKSNTNPDIYIPYTDYSVMSKVETNQAPLFTGLRQRKHHRVQRAAITGSLTLPLFGYYVEGSSMAEHLLQWGNSGPQVPFVDSYTSELFEGDTDNKRHLGLRVGSMRLKGSAQEGAITLSFDLQGKEEMGGITPPVLLSDTPRPVEFLFDDVEMYLGDGEDSSSDEEPVDLRSFELAINNNLQVYHSNSFFPTCIAAGVREVTFQFTVFKRDNTYDLLRRTSDLQSRSCRLVLRGRHLGTAPSGTFTEVQIQLDQLNFSNATDKSSLNELVSQDVEWVALKPSTSSNDVDFSFGLSS